MKLSIEADVAFERLQFERDKRRWREHVSSAVSAVSHPKSPHYCAGTKPHYSMQLGLLANEIVLFCTAIEDRPGGTEMRLWEIFATRVAEADAVWKTDYFDALFSKELRSIPRFRRSILPSASRSGSGS